MYDLRADQEVICYQDSSLNAGVTSLAVSSSGRLIFAGYDDFNCHIWDSLKGEKVGEQSLFKITSINMYIMWMDGSTFIDFLYRHIYREQVFINVGALPHVTCRWCWCTIFMISLLSTEQFINFFSKMNILFLKKENTFISFSIYFLCSFQFTLFPCCHFFSFPCFLSSPCCFPLFFLFLSFN